MFLGKCGRRSRILEMAVWMKVEATGLNIPFVNEKKSSNGIYNSLTCFLSFILPFYSFFFFFFTADGRRKKRQLELSVLGGNIGFGEGDSRPLGEDTLMLPYKEWHLSALKKKKKRSFKCFGSKNHLLCWEKNNYLCVRLLDCVQCQFRLNGIRIEDALSCVSLSYALLFSYT